jgi:hypothetical protein
MIKRDITETVYEYDKEGKLVRKVVTETHEEENNTVTTYPSWSYLNGTQPYCGDTVPCTLTTSMKYDACADKEICTNKTNNNVSITG